MTPAERDAAAARVLGRVPVVYDDVFEVLTPRSAERAARALAGAGLLVPADEEPADLDAIEREWLAPCPSCDAGLPEGCTCPTSDPRPVVAALAAELRTTRAALARVTSPPPPPPAGEVECCASGSCEVCRPGWAWNR